MTVFRKSYWNRIRPFVDKPVIKVITGMRRVGKSCFLKQIMKQLADDGVSEDNLIFVDKEDLSFSHLANAQDLHQYVVSRSNELEGMVYLFVDEVQEIDGWEKAVASFAKTGGIDVYVTGSNAHMLSAELATLISGRYVEFPIYSLGFSEFLSFKGEDAASVDEEFRNYLRFGGMPALFHFEQSSEVIYQYDSAIFNTILLKDIVKRFNVRNVSLLERIGSYLFDNIGQLVSANSISKFLKSQRIKAYPDTVQEYLSYFVSTYLAFRAQRYDLKGKRLLEINDKYFVNDLGMRHAILGYTNADIGQLLENLVYMELKRRAYRVDVGKINEYEVDFVATRHDEKLYIQVAYLLESKETLERELRPLARIKDNYPKMILSMDRIGIDDMEGIVHRNLVDYLLDTDG
jgi:predicted AAA+ superfamily ATPase